MRVHHLSCGSLCPKGAQLIIDYGEVATPPSCPPGLRLFQNLNAADNRAE